jgi:hypothetical protein
MATHTNNNLMKNMNLQILPTPITVMTLLCLGAAGAPAATFNLTCLNSGNWNSAGVRTSSNYQIGYSVEHPDEQAAYFEFDLTPVKGHTITSANLLIVGSTDYNIESYWPNPDNGNPTHIQFKVRCAAQSNPAYPITLAEMTTGNNSVTTYVNMSDFNRNTDLGYGWVADGLHPGVRFDCFHYEKVGIGEGGKKVGPWLQNECNAGGNWCMVTYDGYDFNQAGQRPAENYIWGSTAFNTGIQLQIITSN